MHAPLAGGAASTCKKGKMEPTNAIKWHLLDHVDSLIESTTYGYAQCIHKKDSHGEATEWHSELVSGNEEGERTKKPKNYLTKLGILCYNISIIDI